MVENAIGTVGTFAELLKKFRLGKGLDSGTFNWYASLATRPIVPMAMLRWFWGINDKNKKTQSSDKSSIKKPSFLRVELAKQDGLFYSYWAISSRDVKAASRLLIESSRIDSSSCHFSPFSDSCHLSEALSKYSCKSSCLSFNSSRIERSCSALLVMKLILPLFILLPHIVCQ